ncbi:MAG: peptidylprolyl isomerase [Chloroflexota bacterium]
MIVIRPFALATLTALALALACAPAAPAPQPTPAPTERPPQAAPAAAPSPAAGQAAPAAAGKTYAGVPPMTIDVKKKYTAVMHTSEGDIRIQMLTEDAPATVNNFLFLAKDGFYNGVRFHRIIKGFMVQTGDPLGNGTGNPGYKFNDEPVKRDYVPGTVAMANSGPNTNGSQFFIMHGDYTGKLPRNYTIFGTVAQGQEVVDKIANVPVRPGTTGEASSPSKEVTITGIEVVEQ